jgi:hypothetical protein
MQIVYVAPPSVCTYTCAQMIENDFEAKQSVHIYVPAAHQLAAGLQAAVLQCCYYGLATAQGTGHKR